MSLRAPITNPMGPGANLLIIDILFWWSTQILHPHESAPFLSPTLFPNQIQISSYTRNNVVPIPFSGYKWFDGFSPYPEPQALTKQLPDNIRSLKVRRIFWQMFFMEKYLRNWKRFTSFWRSFPNLFLFLNARRFLKFGVECLAFRFEGVSKSFKFSNSFKQNQQQFQIFLPTFRNILSPASRNSA